MSFLPLPRLKAEVVQTARRLYANGWVANHDGNVSVRLKGDRFLITCTAISKHDVDDTSLLVVDAKGNVLEGRKRPFSELDLHLAIYRSRVDVQAVLHSHAPFATAFGLAGLELAPIALPEVVVSLGSRIPTLPRALPKDPEAVRRLEQEATRCDALLLWGNGVLTWGSDLSMALLRMELVEHYAKILHATRALGQVAPLTDKELEFLLAARKKAGLGPPQKA